MRRLPERTFRIIPTKTPLSTVAIFVAFFSSTMWAQSPGPREFLNTPVNQAVFWTDFLFTKAGTVDANLPLPNNQTVSRVIAPTFMASFPFRNRYAGVSLTAPISTIEVQRPTGDLKSSGFGDPAIALHVNIFGLPALKREEIADAIPQTFLTFHFTFNPPIGSYDRNSPVNSGANRWALTPLVNLNIPINKGVSWFEVYAWGRFYTDNHAFQGSNLLSQRPLGNFAAHYSRNLGKKTFAGIGVFYDYGGETSVNDLPQHDAAHGFRPALTISRKFGRFGATLRYENTASKTNAAPWSGLLLLRVSVGRVFGF